MGAAIVRNASEDKTEPTHKTGEAGGKKKTETDTGRYHSAHAAVSFKNVRNRLFACALSHDYRQYSVKNAGHTIYMHSAGLCLFVESLI